MIEKQKIDRGWIIGGIIVALIAGWGWRHYRPKTAVSEAPALAEVHARPIVEQKVIVEKKYIGYVTPVNEVTVRPYISGFVSQVWVEGGQNVQKGDRLLLIEPAEYQAALEAANAAVDKAEADFSYARDYYERMQKAGARAVSQTELDNAKAQFLAAQAALAQAKAAVRQAEVNLGYTEIKATIDGVVGHVALTPGDYVAPQSQLLSIVQTDPTRVVFAISDKDYIEESRRPKMFAGEQIRLKLVDGSIYGHDGDFRYVDNKIDRATNAVAVYADFSNPERQLVDNEYVTALVEKQYSGVLVSKDLVALRPEGSFVYVAAGDMVKKHRAEILSEYGNDYVLKNNFAPEMRLVMEKITLRGDEQKMKVIETAAGGTK